MSKIYKFLSTFIIFFLPFQSTMFSLVWYVVERFYRLQEECVTSWTKLFATNEVQFTDNAIDNFLTFVDHMSCSADTYVSLGGSNGCADQLTNWDGTQKVGLGIFYKEKKKSQSR